MKKIIALFVVLLALCVVFAACGDDPATTAGKDSTDATGTTEAPAGTTPEDPTGTTTEDPTGTTTEDPTGTTEDPTGTTTEDPGDDQPEPEGIDIYNGDMDYLALTNWVNGMYPVTFENFHAELNFQPAAVINFQETIGGVYEDLIWTDENGATVNPSYTWKLTINDVEYTITEFSIFNNTSNGFVRMGLGDDFEYAEPADPDNPEYGADYTIYLQILDSSGKVTYYADFSIYGPVSIVTPVTVEMVADPDRNPAHKLIEGVSAISGPAGMNFEGYENIADNDIRSKLCTSDAATPIVFSFSTPTPVVSYSLVNANDNESYTDRTPMSWTLEGSNDSSSWTIVDTVDLAAEGVEQADEATNYLERNFVLDNAAEYSYYRLTITSSHGTLQMAEVFFYTE